MRGSEQGKLCARGTHRQQRAVRFCMLMQMQCIKRALRHSGKQKQHQGKRPVLRDEGIFRIYAVNLLHQGRTAAGCRDFLENGVQPRDEDAQLLHILSEMKRWVGLEEQHLVPCGINWRESLKGIEKSSILRRHMCNAYRIAAV